MQISESQLWSAVNGGSIGAYSILNNAISPLFCSQGQLLITVGMEHPPLPSFQSLLHQPQYGGYQLPPLHIITPHTGHNLPPIQPFMPPQPQGRLKLTLFNPIENYHAEMLLDDALNFINAILSRCVDEHRKIMNDPTWITLYNGKRRDVHVMGRDGIMHTISNTLMTFPCHYCGIILPDNLIEVDHQMPNGSAPGIAKTFHTMSHVLDVELTFRRGHGHKSRQSRAIYYKNTQNITPIPVKEYPINTEWNDKFCDEDKNDRYTLTQIGEIILSCMIAVLGTNTVSNICSNSIYNLVPSCATCNRRKKKSPHSAVF